MSINQYRLSQAQAVNEYNMSTSRGKGAGGGRSSGNNNPLASALDKSSRGKGQKRKGSGSDGNSNSKSSSKRGGGGRGGKRGGVDLSRGWKDEEIESGDDEDITDDDDDNDHRDRNSKGGIDGSSDGDDDDIGNGRDETLLAAESAEQKRRRLATEYLNTIKDAVGEDSDNEDGDSGDEVGDVLRKNRLDSSGRLFKSLSSSFADFVPDATTSRCSSSFEGAVTCVALSSHGHSIYTASKDGSLIHHDTETGKRSFIRNRHNHSSSANGGGGSSSSNSSNSREAEQLSIAVSTDDKFIAAGGRDKKIRIYDCRVRNEIKILEGHRDAVTCLAFKHDSADLFSGSLDRCLKQWNLNDMAYIETTFGHQDGVTSIDCWTKSKPVSASGDRTVRIWKMAEDSHLVYRGPKSSIDAVKYVSEEDYLSGGQDGNLHLWKAAIKKPKCVITAAHGYDLVNPRWVSSIGALKMTDLSFSGSYDGFLRVWKTSVDPSSISSLGAIPIEGFINSIDVKEKNGGLLLAVGTGREHKFGRWWNLGGNKDKLHVLRIPANS